MGTLALPVSGIKLQPGGSLTARMAAPPAAASLQVVLATSPADYGKRQAWSVKVGGREIYSAAESDPGAGVARSVFVDLPPASGPLTVEVLADKATRVPITVNTLRLYTGLNPAAPIQNPRPKMCLAMLTHQGSGYSIDADEIRALAALTPASPFVVPQAAVLYNFCVRDAAANEKEIERLAGLAAQTRIPLRIAFQVHWAGIPLGVPDGAGGTFTDLPYQQITFDPDDHLDKSSTGLKALMGDRFDPRFGLSVPNRWSDTPWLTFNHPRLNQFRRVRLTQALHAWLSAREHLAESGLDYLLPPQLSTGEETVYWAEGVDDSKYTQANGGTPRAHLTADFNPFVVADALNDGVNLDPRNGLGNQQRWWLHQNLARQQQRIIDWMFAALPAEPIHLRSAEGEPAGGANHEDTKTRRTARLEPQMTQISADRFRSLRSSATSAVASDSTPNAQRPTPSFAADLVRRNLYTEPYAMPVYPMRTVNSYHPGMEVGYVHEGRSGGEYWSGTDMLPWLLKERERGRIALPNLECSGAGEDQLAACLRAAYACGARFATLYNWQVRPGIKAALKAFADSIEKPTSVIFPLGLGGPGANAAEGMKAPTTRLYTAPPDAFGVNCLELYPRLNIARPAQIRIVLRDAQDSEGPRIATTAMVAPGHPRDFRVYLPTMFPQRPGHRYVVSVETSPGVAVGLSDDGQLAVKVLSDIAVERARSVAIEDRRDACDMVASLRDAWKSHPQPAPAVDALHEAGEALAHERPQQAYAAAVRAEQLALPAAFDVPAPGCALTPYDIEIGCAGGPVRATLAGYDEKSVTVAVQSAAAQRVTISWRGSHATADLSPNIPAAITLQLPQSR